MRFSHDVFGALLSVMNVGAFADVVHFDAQRYDELRREGKPVIVHTDATWCPVCKKQRELLSSIEQEPQFQKVTVFVIDIDADKDIMQSLHLTKRSVFIAYKGNAEVGRSQGDTDKESIEALFAKAL